MSLTLLHTLFDETRRLMVAGSKLAPGDYRLERQIAPLEKLGAKAPVFKKIAEATRAVVDSDANSAAPPLLRLATLTQAVLATQGETGVEGPLADIEHRPFAGTATRTGHKALAPLVEALTTTGSGRLELLRQQFDHRPISDIRLIDPAIRALDDSYGELADYVETRLLPGWGESIVPFLLDGFDRKGNRSHARRLAVLRQLDAGRARELAREIVDDASRPVKVEALCCLDPLEDEDLLLEHAQARTKDIKNAALFALAGSQRDEVVATFVKLTSRKSIGEVREALSRCNAPEVKAAVLGELERSHDDWSKGKNADERGKAMARMADLVQCLAPDPRHVELLAGYLQMGDGVRARERDAFERFGLQVAMQLLRLDTEAADHALIENRDRLFAGAFMAAVVAAARRLDPREAFKALSAYAKGKTAKERDRLDYVWACMDTDPHWSGYYGWDGWDLDHDIDTSAFEWDKRWIDVGIKLGQPAPVLTLAGLEDRKAMRYLGSLVEDVDHDAASSACARLFSLGSPKALVHLRKALQNAKKRRKINHYRTRLLLEGVGFAARSIHPEIRKLAEQFPEIADTLFEYLYAARSRSDE